MTKRYSQDYLKDIQEAIHLALEFTQDIDFDSFCQDTKTIFAVTRAIQIVGEVEKDMQSMIAFHFFKF
jgi:uncharacterized protein with HEPN domain